MIAILAGGTFFLSFISGFVMMIVSGMGAPGPSFGQFLIEIRLLAVPIIFAVVALVAAICKHVWLGLSVVIVAMAALAWFWFPFFT